jgi:hypothetical protein
MDCVIFNACHDDWQTGSCGEWHCGCNAINCPHHDDMLLGSRASLAVDDLDVNILAEAARDHKPQAFAQLLAAHSDRLILNRARGVVQLVGCGAQVVAQYPVSTEGLALGTH